MRESALATPLLLLLLQLTVRVRDNDDRCFSCRFIYCQALAQSHRLHLPIWVGGGCRLDSGRTL